MTLGLQRPSRYHLNIPKLQNVDSRMASSASATAPSSRKRPAPLTKLARKYGHPYKKIKDMSHRILKYTGKSGITPLSPFFPQNMQNRTPRSRRQKYQFHFYQKHRYQGFAAAELHGMEALSALDTTKTSSPLINPIHPMFAKDKWDGDNDIPRHWPLLPLFTGHKGFWQVGFSNCIRGTVANYFVLLRSAIQPCGGSSSPHSDLLHVF